MKTRRLLDFLSGMLFLAGLESLAWLTTTREEDVTIWHFTLLFMGILSVLLALWRLFSLTHESSFDLPEDDN